MYASLVLWGGGRFYNLADRTTTYLDGLMTFVHNCDVRSFGLVDILAAATETSFRTGNPSRAWYTLEQLECESRTLGAN